MRQPERKGERACRCDDPGARRGAAVPCAPVNPDFRNRNNAYVKMMYVTVL